MMVENGHRLLKTVVNDFPENSSRVWLSSVYCSRWLVPLWSSAHCFWWLCLQLQPHLEHNAWLHLQLLVVRPAAGYTELLPARTIFLPTSCWLKPDTDSTEKPGDHGRCWSDIMGWWRRHRWSSPEVCRWLRKPYNKPLLCLMVVIHPYPWISPYCWDDAGNFLG